MCDAILLGQHLFILVSPTPHGPWLLVVCFVSELHAAHACVALWLAVLVSACMLQPVGCRQQLLYRLFK